MAQSILLHIYTFDVLIKIFHSNNIYIRCASNKDTCSFIHSFDTVVGITITTPPTERNERPSGEGNVNIVDTVK